MNISKLLFVFISIAFLAFILTWINAYDVFYNGASSTFFGSDSVTYLRLTYNIDTIQDAFESFLNRGIGSIFGSFGIMLISKFLNDFFGDWALYGSIFFNLIFIYFSYLILDKSYDLQLRRFKSNALIITYIFPVVLIYIVGPNKEIFTFVSSCILVRLSTLNSIPNINLRKNALEIFFYFCFILTSVFVREIYILVIGFSMVFLVFKRDIIRYALLYFSTIIFYFIRPEQYLGSDKLLRQASSVVTLQLEKYFDEPLTFVIQIFGKAFISIFGIFYPSRFLEIFSGNYFFLVRLLFSILIFLILFGLYKLKGFKIQKFKFSQLTKNLSYCLIMMLMIFSLGNYISDRKIIPTYPICIALIASLRKDRIRSANSNFDYNRLV